MVDKELMKERLLANTTTIVKAQINEEDDKEILITVIEDILKERVARDRLLGDNSTLTITIDLGYKPSKGAMDEAIAIAKKRLLDAMDPKF